MNIGQLSILGFAGRQGAGKTTAAQLFENEDFTKISFAGALKLMLVAAGVPKNYIYGNIADKNTTFNLVQGRNPDKIIAAMFTALNVVNTNQPDVKVPLLGNKTPREAAELLKQIGFFDNKQVSARILAQLLGTEWGREIDPNIWTNIVGNQIRDALRHGKQKFVIDDVRFPNEVELIKQFKNSLTIKLIIEDDEDEGIENHKSEQSHLLKCDGTVFNWKTSKYQLRHSIVELISHLG